MHSLEKHWISHWMRTTKEKLITLDQSRPERRPRPLIGQTAAVVARQVCDYLLAAHRRNGRTAPAGRRRCFIGGWRWRPYSEVVFFQDFLFQQKKKRKRKEIRLPIGHRYWLNQSGARFLFLLFRGWSFELKFGNWTRSFWIESILELENSMWKSACFHWGSSCGKVSISIHLTID